MPPWLVSNVLWFGDTTALANSPWTAASNIVEVKPGIAEYKLVFVWIGSKADVDRGPGACVDNIKHKQI